ncbi:MAG: DUF1778 domain-containing protein [Rhodobacter sp.]|nr:DUF1778 domain-containing protein [Rhodobacter sp.]
MLSFTDAEARADERATDRIEMRVRPSDRKRMERAAELTGVRLATFVRASAARGAERVLSGYQATALSERDRRTLLEALDNPPPPTGAARDAVRAYRSRIANAG